MRQIVLRLRNLSLVGSDPPENLGSLLRQSLDNQQFRHAAIETDPPLFIQPSIWCVCYLRP